MARCLREHREIRRLTRAEVSLGGDVEAHGLADRRGKAGRQPLASGAVVLVVPEPVVALPEEMADVVQQRGKAQSFVGSLGARERGRLQAVLGNRDAFAISLAAVGGEEGRDLVEYRFAGHVSRSSTLSLDISESASA